MGQNYAAAFFPKNLAKTEKRRSETLENALTADLVASLLSMRFNREPVYKSIEEFYTQEYQSALQAGVAPAELSKIQRYRMPTQKEVNLLFCDIHAKEQMYEYSGGSNGE